MKKALVPMIVISIVMLFTLPAHALLIDCGGGMIYSTDLDVTWLQDANYAMTSGQDSDGLMTWEEANAWVAGLTYNSYNDWRLPTFDPDNPDARINATLLHEMGYLSYVELGNPGNGGGDLQNAGPFINLLPDPNNYLEPWYWSGTSDPQDSSAYYRFDFECG